MDNLEAWEVVSRPLPRSTYAHARHRAMTARIFVILAALAVVWGALWGLSNAMS